MKNVYYLIFILFLFGNKYMQGQTVRIDTVSCYVYLRFDTCADYEFINAYILANNEKNTSEIPLYDDLSFNDVLFKMHPQLKKELLKKNKTVMSNLNKSDDYTVLFEKLIDGGYMNYTNDSSSSCRYLNSNYFFYRINEADKEHPSSILLMAKAKLIVFNYSNTCLTNYDKKPVKRPVIEEQSSKWWCADYTTIDHGICEFDVLYKLLSLEKLDLKNDADFTLKFQKNVKTSIKICAFE